MKKAKRRSSGKFNTLHATVDKLAEQKRGAQHYMTLQFSGFHCDELMNYQHAELQVIHKQSKCKVSSIVSAENIDFIWFVRQTYRIVPNKCCVFHFSHFSS